MTLFTTDILARADELAAQIAALPLNERVVALNAVRQRLAAASPFQTEPVDCVQWVPAGEVGENDYNPNHVAPPELRLLALSIAVDGYTMPIVGMRDLETGATHVVDGAHRTRVGREHTAIRRRLHSYLPVAYIRAERGDRSDRMAATIRHNRARGVHAISPMIGIVTDLIRAGWTDAQIGRELGMDPDEVLRYKQASGLAELFKDQPFGRAWE